MMLKIFLRTRLSDSATFLFAAVYVLAVYALCVGIDFGTHWDEVVHYNLVVQSYQYQIFLPHFYHYPGMMYLISLASVADKLFAILSSMIDRGIFWSRVYTSIAAVYSPADKPEGLAKLIELSPLIFREEIPIYFNFFILRARLFAMIISCWGGVWIFLSLRASDLARPALAGALGGSIYLLSWEFGYHARWFAPDLILAQFVALFIFFLVKAERADNASGWLISAAVAAGLATVTKYTAGGLVPALWLYVLTRGGRAGRPLLATLALHTAVAVGVFVLITPGVLLEPLRFATDVLYVMHHYSRSHGIFFGVSPYDIHDHWIYLLRLWEYFSLALLSPQPVLAAVFAAVSLLGLVSSWHRSRPLTAALGFLIIFYSIFFSMQGVFIVRNFLILLPVFAYLAGVGFDALIDREFKLAAGRQVAILGTGLALVIAFGWSAWQQVAFGWSIGSAKREPLVLQVGEYLEKHASMPIALSPCLSTALSGTGARLPANITEPSRARRYIFRMSELTAINAHLAFWPATRHDTLDWIGPREVNLNYYPTWTGADHAIILSMSAAERTGVVEALSHGRPPNLLSSCQSPPVRTKNQ